MHRERPLAAVRRALDQDRETLGRAVERVPASRRRERPAPDRWSVAEVLEHLAIVEERSLRILHKLIADAPRRETAGAVEATALARGVLRDRTRLINAPDHIQPTGQVPAEEAWARLQRSRAELLAALDLADDRDFARVTRQHPALGTLDGYQWLAAIGGHEERHALQIEEIASALEAGRT